MYKEIQVEEDGAKERMDKFLTQQFSEFSRSHLQKLNEEGLILVNDKKVPSHYFLKTGDRIKIDLKGPKKIDLSPDHQTKLNIVFENDDFLVINKPSGQVVHPAESYREKTLVNQLLAYYPEIKNVGEDPLRPGIVHRLDKEVSGLLVITKNQNAFEHLKNQFQEHRVKKEYLALVYGIMKEKAGVINFKISRGKSGKMVAKPLADEGKEALTEFEVMKHIRNKTLVLLKPQTGRTHQLRAHLKAIGYPIVGDPLYKMRKLKIKNEPSRILLHARTLGFNDLGNKWLEFNSPLPPEFKKFL
jgi:23S rRNA pseudouridine1911/1915/1917 synthase